MRFRALLLRDRSKLLHEFGEAQNFVPDFDQIFSVPSPAVPHDLVKGIEPTLAVEWLAVDVGDVHAEPLSGLAVDYVWVRRRSFSLKHLPIDRGSPRAMSRHLQAKRERQSRGSRDEPGPALQ